MTGVVAPARSCDGDVNSERRGCDGTAATAAGRAAAVSREGDLGERQGAGAAWAWGGWSNQTSAPRRRRVRQPKPAAARPDWVVEDSPPPGEPRRPAVRGPRGEALSGAAAITVSDFGGSP